MTRNCVILSCSLMCLLVLTTPASAQTRAALGTPPPVGHMIEEIATAEADYPTQVVDLDGGAQGFYIDLPLPVFPSTQLPASPSQCMWWLEYTSFDISGVSFFSHEVIICAPPTLTSDSTAYVSFDVDWGFAEGTLGVHCSVYAVAIRTAPPAPVESKSFGEIKAMFRDE